MCSNAGLGVGPTLARVSAEKLVDRYSGSWVWSDQVTPASIPTIHRVWCSGTNTSFATKVAGGGRHPGGGPGVLDTELGGGDEGGAEVGQFAVAAQQGIDGSVHCASGYPTPTPNGP